MHRGSNFGFPSAQHSVPASHSLHTNHFLYLKRSEEEDEEEEEGREGANRTMKQWKEATKAADRGHQKQEMQEQVIEVVINQPGIFPRSAHCGVLTSECLFVWRMHCSTMSRQFHSLYTQRTNVFLQSCLFFQSFSISFKVIQVSSFLSQNLSFGLFFHLRVIGADLWSHNPSQTPPWLWFMSESRRCFWTWHYLISKIFHILPSCFLKWP